MSKGTRSVKRKLRKLSGREKRFTENVIHIVSKTLVESHPQAKFVLEDLTKIRSNRITYRGKDKEARRQAEQWPFASLQKKIEYKAKLYCGVTAEYVDPSYTSQTCPVCGRKYKPSDRNFRCPVCSFEYHRDGVGAINIYKKYTGCGLVVVGLAPAVGVRYNPHLCGSGVSPWKLAPSQ